jgi:hypothetical protein
VHGLPVALGRWRATPGCVIGPRPPTFELARRLVQLRNHELALAVARAATATIRAAATAAARLEGPELLIQRVAAVDGADCEVARFFVLLARQQARCSVRLGAERGSIAGVVANQGGREHQSPVPYARAVHARQPAVFDWGVAQAQDTRCAAMQPAHSTPPHSRQPRLLLVPGQDCTRAASTNRPGQRVSAHLQQLGDLFVLALFDVQRAARRPMRQHVLGPAARRAATNNGIRQRCRIPDSGPGAGDYCSQGGEPAQRAHCRCRCKTSHAPANDLSGSSLFLFIP